MTRPHPYAGATVALATKHAKERAIAPALGRTPGMRVVVAEGIDTDRLGTFTGEVERPAPPRETAMMKARLALRESGESRGLASEGAFGPHPHLFVVPAGLEILAFVDDELGVEVVEQRLSCRTNFSHLTSAALDRPTLDFLSRVGFGTHAVVVQPNIAEAGRVVHKGVVSRDELAGAIIHSARASSDGLARVETDMRAHLNPTRMRQIALLAGRLAVRLAARCPACDAPGYGPIDTARGLPCGACGEATEWALAEIDGCTRCEMRRDRPRSDGLTVADPAWCAECNP